MDELRATIREILYDEMMLDYGCCDQCGPSVDGHYEAARRIAELFEEMGVGE